MSAPTCTTASLNLQCFRGQVLDPHTRKALMVYFKAAELNAIGGTNYLSLLTSPASGGLLGDTNALMDFKISQDEVGTRVIGTYEIAVAFNSAVAAGMATASIQTRMQNIKCLINVPEWTLDKMMILLDCQLGVHKSYPQ